MANATAGFAHRKGAIAAARRVLGTDAVIDSEFEVFPIADGRFDWKAVERKKAQRRTSGKGSPFAAQDQKGPSAKEVADAEKAIEANAKGAPLGPALSEPNLPTETVTVHPAEPLGAALQDAGDDHKPSKGASAFGAFAQQQLGNNGAERRAEDKGGSKRTTDKPAGEKKTRVPPVIQNGVRQPTVGTVCREVWDELDRIRTEQSGTPPDSKQVKKLAEDKKWNANNASIEFYQWRKFNNITGRTKPAPVAVKPKSE